MNKKEHRSFNYPRAIRLAALLFLALGCANIWYGDKRSSRYAILLVEAESKLSDPDSNRDQQLRYTRRLRARIVLYSTVESGGRALVGIGILLLVAAFLAPVARPMHPPQLPVISV